MAQPLSHLMKEHPYEHIREVLKIAVNRGFWYDDAWLMLVKWLLHGFGVPDMQRYVDAIDEEIRDFWYERFNLAYLMVLPIDWSATILQSVPTWMGNGQAKWAKSSAFFSTPMNVCDLMTRMSFYPPVDDDGQPIDFRIKTVIDPCCGTGSMLLPASNYSLRLYGIDIVQELVHCAMLNGFLFAPWMVCNPPSVIEMWERIDPENASASAEHNVPAAPPLALETDPVRVAETKAYREEQYAMFQAIGAPEAQAVTPKPKAPPLPKKAAADVDALQESLFGPA